ncbi:SDR family NAD(P)-dependent oxidoreductase [Erwinia sp. CPCC 100877]|nr:SDR family NAD(P)-dependent oxidoreductase [Erwinia sp. CPCC 100877]
MKYTVITGASSGIGYETALAFAAKGKNLILVARRVDKLEELKEKILSINNTLSIILKSSDLSEREQVYGLYQDLKSYDIETWVNNAGFGDSSLIIDENLQKIESMLRVNIDAVTILSTLYAQDYADKENTQLINVSSAMGYVLALGNTVYSATKYYVSVYTEGLARELQGHQLKAKVLAPAITETEFIDKANNVENFDYSTGVKQYHTAKEMAQFLIKLYESNHTVGIVNEKYEFTLNDGIHLVLQGI